MKKITVRELGLMSDVKVTNDSYLILSEWVTTNLDQKTYDLLELGDVEKVEWDLPATFTFEDVKVKLTVIYYLGTWYQTFYSSEWDLWEHERYKIPLEFNFYGKNKVFVEAK